MFYLCCVTIKNWWQQGKFSNKAMKTFGELKSFCEKNNVRYEISPIYSNEYYNPFSNEYHKTLLGWNFGMNNIAGRKGKSEWQWTWFETVLSPEKLEEDTQFFFKHRYSMLNGKSYRGCMEFINAESIIEKRMA